MFNNRTCFQNHTLQQWSPTSRESSLWIPVKLWTHWLRCEEHRPAEPGTRTHIYIHTYIHIYIYKHKSKTASSLHDMNISFFTLYWFCVSFTANIKLKSLCLTFIWAQSHRTEWRHRVLLQAADWCALSVTVYKVLFFISSLYDVNMILDVEFPCLYGRVLQDTWSFTSLYWFSLL